MSEEETTEAPKASKPGMEVVTVRDYVHQVATLVAEVSRRHKIPHGTAYNIVAWGTTHLEELSQRAQFARESATTEAEALLADSTPEES